NATAAGPLKRARLNAPSTFSGKAGEPGSVVTTPAGVIWRIELLKESATKTLPVASTARPAGPENRAVPPVPSTDPEFAVPGRPASVVTTPSGVILRTALLL